MKNRKVHVTFVQGLEDGPAYVACSDSETFMNEDEAKNFVKTWYEKNTVGYYSPAPMITKQKYSYGETISPDEFK